MDGLRQRRWRRGSSAERRTACRAPSGGRWTLEAMDVVTESADTFFDWPQHRSRRLGARCHISESSAQCPPRCAPDADDRRVALGLTTAARDHLVQRARHRTGVMTYVAPNHD